MAYNDTAMRKYNVYGARNEHGSAIVYLVLYASAEGDWSKASVDIWQRIENDEYLNTPRYKHWSEAHTEPLTESDIENYYLRAGFTIQDTMED